MISQIVIELSVSDKVWVAYVFLCCIVPFSILDTEFWRQTLVQLAHDLASKLRSMYQRINIRKHDTMKLKKAYKTHTLEGFFGSF
jgi:hypothetical protein